MISTPKTDYGEAHDHRGLVIEKLVDDNDFVVLNNGQPTYSHYNGTQSHLDLSLVYNTLAAKSFWEVRDNPLGLDHSPTITHMAL